MGVHICDKMKVVEINKKPLVDLFGYPKIIRILKHN
jgi:hypothetical protein